MRDINLPMLHNFTLISNIYTFFPRVLECATFASCHWYFSYVLCLFQRLVKTAQPQPVWSCSRNRNDSQLR